MELWILAGWVTIIGGLIGLFLPFLPGPPLIFLGALFIDIGSAWTRFGPIWLIVLAVLMVLSIGADWWLSNMLARRGGASWPALLVGFLLGLGGLFFLGPPGLVIGSIGGVVGTELWRQRNVGAAARAGGGWLVGWLAGLLVEVGVGAAMLVIILVQMR